MTHSKDQTPEEITVIYASEDQEDQRSLRVSLVIAFALHLAFLFTAIPTLQSSEAEPAAKPKVLKLTKTPPFRNEPEPPKEKPKPRQRVREIPVPDLTPDEDPYVFDPNPVVELDLDPDVFLKLPEAPPQPQAEEQPMKPVRVGRVAPPTREYYVEPRYPPLAKRARIQGTVVLEATIDVDGRVVDLKVVTAQPFGLTEAAVEAVSTWRFKPSRLGDKVVPVLYRLEVAFKLR